MCAEGGGDEEARGSRSAWLEQQYRERMEAILEGMQEGPLFQVMVPCSVLGWACLLWYVLFCTPTTLGPTG